MRKVNTNLSLENQAYLFDNVYMVSQNKKYFENAYLEFSNDIGRLLCNELHNASSGFECNTMNAVKLQYINELNKRLGLSSSMIDNQRIERYGIESCMEYFQMERKNIHDAFAMKDQKTTETFNFRSTLDLVRKIYIAWTNTDIAGENKDRKNICANYVTKNKCFAKIQNIFPTDDVDKEVAVEDRMY